MSRRLLRLTLCLALTLFATGCGSGSGSSLDATSDSEDDGTQADGTTAADTSDPGDATTTTTDDTSTTDDTAADTSTTDDTSTTTTDAAVDTMEDTTTMSNAVVVLSPGSIEVENGGEFADGVLNGIPPWSFGITTATLRNDGDTAVTLSSIDIAPIGETDVDAEWFTSEAGTTTLTPTDYADTPIPAGETVSVGFYFRPIASGDRDAQVTFTYDDGATHTFEIWGRGRDNATLSPVVANGSWERIFARSNLTASHSMQPGAIAADTAGNLYINSAVNGYSDTFSEDMVFAQITADGNLGWVREWTEDFEQYNRDVGDNGEIGPGPSSIDVDAAGQLFFAAQRSQSSGNSVFQAMFGRIDTATGDMIWSRGFTNGTDAVPTTTMESMRGQVLDATLTDRVIVAGDMSGGAFVAALDKADGAPIWVRRIVHTGQHRWGTLKVVGDHAFLSGTVGNHGFITRIDGVSGAAPSVAWAREYASFSLVKGMDADATRLVAAVEVRGAATAFVGAGIDPANGNVLWSKVWDATNATDSNNTLGILLDGDTAIVHGRIAIVPFDTQGGDGFLLALDATSGAYQWGSFYYTGKGAEELVWHHITGMVKTAGGELYTVSQATPAPNNKNHFYGRWYQANDFGLDFPGGDGSERLVDYGYTGSDVTGATTFEDLTTTTFHTIDSSGPWRSYDMMQLQDPEIAEAEGFQTGVHVLVQRVDVTTP